MTLDDNTLARLERGLTSGAENAEIAKALAAGTPANDAVIAPITTAVPASIPPVAYVIHRWAKHCLTCGAIHYYSDVFALNHLKSHWGKYVRNLTPITRPEWNVPLHTYDLPPKAVPFCHECPDLAAAHLAMLPRPPVPQAPIGTSNLSTAEGGGARNSAPASAEKAKNKKKVWDTDDLLV